MKAVAFNRPGPPEVLRTCEFPDPQPGRGQVVINVQAAGVNRSDLMERGGGFYPIASTPTILGLECSGTIRAVGPAVTGWQVGDEVCALLSMGGYAEQVVAEDTQILPRPASVGITSAAGLMEAAATVMSNFDIAQLRQSDTLLIHGGASGIGTFAIQLAHAMGLRTIVTAGSDEKAAICRQLGADVTINYRKTDFVAAVHDHTSGRGADVIVDIMGASYLTRNVDALAPNGRLVVIGFLGGTTAEVDLRAFMQKRATLHVTALKTRSVAEKAAIIERVRSVVWPLVTECAVKPIIDRIYPLAAAPEAHRYLDSGTHVGKVLLAVQRD